MTGNMADTTADTTADNTASKSSNKPAAKKSKVTDDNELTDDTETNKRKLLYISS